jgi:hypothetical protein
MLILKNEIYLQFIIYFNEQIIYIYIYIYIYKYKRMITTTPNDEGHSSTLNMWMGALGLNMPLNS